MEGFREWFDKALRVDDTHDWSVHSVEYSIFKKRLVYFRDRRKRLKVLLKNSPQNTLPEKVVASIIGPKSHLPDNNFNYGPLGTGYVPFVDLPSSEDESNTATIVINRRWNRKKVMHRKVVSRVSERSVAQRLSTAERNEVGMFLSREMDKVTIFYMAQWQNLSRIMEEQGQSSDTLGDEILELLAFCTANIVATRQTLIRYDAFARIHGSQPMLQWYMIKMVKEHNQTSFRKVLKHQELKALIDLYVAEHKDTCYFRAQLAMFEGILESSERAESIASTGHVTTNYNCMQQIQDLFALGLVEDQLGLQSEYLISRGQSLTGEIQMIARWREHPQQVETETEPVKKMSWKELFALTLNLLSAFFYCMNYYIVEPSSTKYVNALGASDNYSGLLIGMMPIAALCSAIVYSIWTNRCFRMPLLVSGTSLIVGNIMYASALKSESIVVAMSGRFLTGLGGPKCIVRRYMADTVPISSRTSVSAAFGMAVAVGSALGPAAAILVDEFEFAFKLPFLGEQYFNGMTGPGWFMAALWIIYTLVVFVTFGEPDRDGLEEQKRLENKLLGEPPPSEEPDRMLKVMQVEGSSSSDPTSPVASNRKMDDDLHTIFTNDGETVSSGQDRSSERSIPSSIVLHDTWWHSFQQRLKLVILPVRLCLFFLFCKTFTIEALVSATSALTKNRYGWQVRQVGTLGCINGILVVPLSITMGFLSHYYQDRVLMTVLVSIGSIGLFLLIDFTDLVGIENLEGYNDGNPWAVHPPRYVTGYFLAFCSVQCFEGVIGSTLSKVIPTALASGTFNSGLLATLVDTLGRASGDCFIFFVGQIDMRQLMNLLFIPAFSVLIICLILIQRNYAALQV